MVTIVWTKSGGVRGEIRPDGTHTFLGIPYAKPPLDELRYQTPVPVDPWTGIRDALTYGPSAPQAPPGAGLFQELIIPGDDFLNLNVYTPDLGSARLPVLVWIHGGAFIRGSNSAPLFRGDSFARNGVVVVTINYRLGVEGYLRLQGAPANRGLLDMLAALAWVQDNIARFGGDPDRVTIGGQSAGGVACATLLAARQADGLFRGVISMSGGAHLTVPAGQAQALAERAAAELGLPATRDAFAAVPIGETVRLQEKLYPSGGSAAFRGDPVAFARRTALGLPLAPGVDGDLVPALAIDAIRSGSGSGTALLVGNTADEHKMLASTGLASTEADALPDALAMLGLSTESATAYLASGAPPPRILAQAFGDFLFRVPALRLAEARAAAAATWVYQFDWPSPVHGGAVGAGHGICLPFAWNQLHADGSAALVGDDPPQQLADAMHEAWVRFITVGSPGWPAYRPDRRATMLFDETCRLADDPLYDLRAAWSGLR